MITKTIELKLGDGTFVMVFYYTGVESVILEAPVCREYVDLS